MYNVKKSTGGHYIESIDWEGGMEKYSIFF